MAIIEDNIITQEVNSEGFPPKVSSQSNIYKPSAIKRYGPERFLTQVAPKEPIQPNFTFTPEEQQRMDALLAKDKAA